jgi:hypothetical protein
MEIDDAIVQLGAKLDAWLDGNLGTIPTMDRVAQFKALLAGIEITKELDRLKAKELAILTALLNRDDATTGDERIASLIRAFEFASKLAATLHDELLDVKGETDVLLLLKAIDDRLDSTRSGRAALAVLLDHPDARVRAQAGASLVRLMPERVLPILREIEDKGNGDSADFTAHWAIVGWEREGKHKTSEPPT